MRIAIVGKGGAGKTTISALLCLQAQMAKYTALACDADVNVGLGELVGLSVTREIWMASPSISLSIKSFLKGTNPNVSEPQSMVKTTPPGRGSARPTVKDLLNMELSWILKPTPAFGLCSVGTYSAQTAGLACHHNHLAVLELLLSHLRDDGEVVIVDTVAGSDVFATTLFQQFDLMVLSVEPHAPGIKMARDFVELARATGVMSRIGVLANRVRSNEDVDLIKTALRGAQFLGAISESEALRRHLLSGGELSLDLIDEPSRVVLTQLLETGIGMQRSESERLGALVDLHRRYVSQPHITSRFGDLSSQIDSEFLRE